MTCFLTWNYNILLKRDLRRSLQVVILQTSGPCQGTRLRAHGMAALGRWPNSERHLPGRRYWTTIEVEAPRPKRVVNIAPTYRIYAWLSKYGSLLGPLNTKCRIILRAQPGTIILTTTHILFKDPRGLDCCKGI